MTILEKKDGVTTEVVNDLINQIKKFKIVTSDKSFLDFVAKLEIIKMDL